MKRIESLPLHAVVLLWATILSNVIPSSKGSLTSSDVREVVPIANIPVQEKSDFHFPNVSHLRDIDHGKALVDWLRTAKGSYFHPDLEIRKSDPNNSTSPFYGMFAKDKIHASELLLEIPQSMVLKPGLPQVGDRVTVIFDEDEDDDEDDELDGGEYEGIVTAINLDGTYDVLCDTDDEPESNIPISAIEHEQWPVNCATVRLLAKEMRLAGDSRYAPYVNYLLTQPAGQIPTAWSKAGQALLKKIIGRDIEGQDMLPPSRAFRWLEEDWAGRCKGSDDPLEIHAYLLVIARGWDEMLIPVFDMLSHRNGVWTNTQHDSIRSGNTIKVRASRDIQAGEEIYTSYNFCDDCAGRYQGYGTPEILRDYGFVEDYPRRFVFAQQEISFDIDFDSLTGKLEVEWISSEPEEEELIFLEDQLERLMKVNQTALKRPNPDVPKHELHVVSQYLEALTTAISEAITQASETNTDDNSRCVEETGTCSLSSTRYPKLTVDAEEWETARPNTCDYRTVFGYLQWETLYETKTQYQEMAFDVNPTMGYDMCFDLDGVVQMCESYRPQYHEMFVHYTARFIDEVKRVLFVGGGDSMLLHEALKYPSLELVVGLELDQDVTRNCFKYFGTQPHWDNNKVEWWFGDATKSLVVLPKEYFGSFDLVLVDLSETVMALTVTEELDVIEALALLVKPSGILVQNEYGHFVDHTHNFKNTLTIHYDSVPVVCSQSLVLASNGVDFLRGPYKKHQVDYLYDLLETKDVRYEIVRDYQRNNTNPRHCNNYKGTSVERSTAQIRSPGVLMIIEAEDANVNMNSTEDLKFLLNGALANAGLTVVSSAMKTLEDGCIMAFILKEGYVIARAWSSHKYIAYNLHLWSNFNKQDNAKKELITAVGSQMTGKSSSAFRIVAGGMFGLNNWEEETRKLGPHLEDFCAGAHTAVHNKTNNIQPQTPEVAEVVLNESMSMYKSQSYPVAVLCGQKGQECKSVELLKKSMEVIPIWTCLDIVGSIEFTQHGLDQMQVCEHDILQTLHNSTHKIHALVLDQSASYHLAQVVIRIFKSAINKEELLTDDIFVHASIFDGAEWRKAFVDYFRQRIFNDEVPMYRAEVQFNGTSSHFEVAMAMSGDSLFPQALARFVDRVEETTGYLAEIKNLRSGAFIYEDEFHSHAVFSFKDYDRTDQFKQWEEQEVFGLQTVIQFELIHNKYPLTCEKLKMAFQTAISQVVSSSEKESPEKEMKTMENSEIGEGCILISFWPDGHAALLWDGRSHFDMNIFTELVDEDKEDFSEDFEEAFLYQIRTVKKSLRDEFPRGTGRVVNFPEPNGDPYWK